MLTNKAQLFLRSARIDSSASMTSSRLTCDFLNFSRTLNAFEAGAYVKLYGVARRPALGFAVTFRVSSRVSPPARVIFSISATIFFGSPCRTICRRSDLDSMSPSRQRLLTSSGIAFRVTDSVIEVAGLAEPPGQFLVGVVEPVRK